MNAIQQQKDYYEKYWTTGHDQYSGDKVEMEDELIRAGGCFLGCLKGGLGVASSCIDVAR